MTQVQVAIVAPSLRILGGQSVQADRLLRAWQGDADVRAWLVPHNPVPPRLLRSGLKVKFARTFVTEMTYLPLLARELSKADIVHIFSASYSSFLLAPLPAAVVARALRKPIVLNYHSGEAPDHLARSRVARAALSRVDRVVVPSPFLAAVFRQFDIAATVIPNTIDVEQFSFAPREPLRPKILSTRNFGYPYNVACTLRAFREIQDRRPEASLTLVGAGADERMLRALAGDLGLRNVRFLGPVDPNTIATVYAEHDIYLQSPDIDNMPLSILEAFASGLPVVSTAVGGVPAMLTDGDHGLLAPANDHHALADHVLRLLDDPDFARRLTRAARGTCRAYEWTVVRDQWVRLYASVVDRATPAAADSPAVLPTLLTGVPATEREGAGSAPGDR